MLSQLTKPRTMNQYTLMNIKNINNDPCEYLRYQFEKTPYLKEKIKLYQILVNFCNEPTKKD